ncbi:D-tyrosyl-tRNA(Tyr) deacylase [Aedoeadaptatus ivorii]|uniref:D-aminoacyl-tRNA deacylase n=1 Tax=Aedoeadaptatus ivorii TaxID=54006 RepID=A0A448V1R0_9FIRM|nr:D-aminoacyl-tRNA deacylase [Peptoniphilus ivorii]MDQ0507861.1 D-tyrosyl-tRNA(Tyr) deacylase [Peptoniphilus ivorii]VEJ35688.1 D-tyrosyl-tRNA(Tyr) deacylase [Peptoniphilus ivorii]
MRAVVQRVKYATVSVDGEIISRIDAGLMVLIGIREEDDKKDIEYIGKKITGLRIFPDEEGVMNVNVQDTGGEIMIVSQFTLYGDAQKGNRPSYIRAAKGEISEAVYEDLIAYVEKKGFSVATGQFGADMQIEMINDGPVTILLDSERSF